MVGILSRFLLGVYLFSGAMLVFREGKVCVYITLTVLGPGLSSGAFAVSFRYNFRQDKDPTRDGSTVRGVVGEAT